MQFKRDTDYALRLLFSAAKHGGEGGISLSELCIHSAVPRAIASRLCPKLVESDFLKESKEKSRAIYFVGENIDEKTLLDAVLATEESVDMFAVFDRTTDLYACSKDAFAEVEQRLIKGLSEIRFRELIEKSDIAK